MSKCVLGDQGVAEGVLLVEEAGVGAGLDVEPGAPLVDDQADAPAWVVAVHDRGVAGDEPSIRWAFIIVW